ENDEGDSIYVLAEGKVCLERRVKNHRPVPPTQITIVRQGQLFGEMGFLENQKRSATARAKGNIQLLVIDSGDLRKLISDESQFAIKFMSNLALILSARLRRMNEQWLNAISHDFQLPEFEYL
ncbi:MAG: cyclic nucleotide-binding domain-containing protein, partial [Calditrichaeota bacterium]|nr:cyclic nucleotide-binding domain-containing protein [Calditrichota bacterium]